MTIVVIGNFLCYTLTIILLNISQRGGNGMKQKHLIVISVDALVYEDLEYAKELPVFGDILENGSLIKRVKTMYK